MPGYASWKDLYKEELLQLKEEGYDVSTAPKMEDDGGKLLPFPGCGSTDLADESAWELAYQKLIEIYNGEQRADFYYYEPNDFHEILKSASPAPELIPLTDEQYSERIKGAFFGRVAAVILGKPLEIGIDHKGVKDYLVGADAWPLNDYVPEHSPKSEIKVRTDCLVSCKGNVSYAQSDDDIHYTLLALHMAEQNGYDFTPKDVGMNWLDNVPYHWFWCASRQSLYHMINQLPVEKIPTTLNPWRECIDGQIRTDLWGYIAPADLKKAAFGAYKDCEFSLIKNGIYGGMFVAGCLAAALSAGPTVDLILDGGLAVIPEKSRLAEAVRNVRGWYAQSGSFDYTCDKIYEHYGHLPFAATINNLSIVVLAILEGNMDYSKTITAAVCGGIDTDCNAGTAGSIIGAAVGINGIEERWYEPLNDTIKSNVATFGQVSMSEIVDRIEAVYHKLKANSGEAK